MFRQIRNRYYEKRKYKKNFILIGITLLIVTIIDSILNDNSILEILLNNISYLITEGRFTSYLFYMGIMSIIISVFIGPVKLNNLVDKTYIKTRRKYNIIKIIGIIPFIRIPLFRIFYIFDESNNMLGSPVIWIFILSILIFIIGFLMILLGNMNLKELNAK